MKIREDEEIANLAVLLNKVVSTKTLKRRKRGKIYNQKKDAKCQR